MTTPQLVEVSAAHTYPLRRSVLRSGTPTTNVTFDEDEWPGVVHLALRVDRDLVAVSTWIPRPYETHPAVQLRGMATATELQGSGLGGILLEAGCERMARDGVALVWARARDSALTFYGRHGFEIAGDGFIDATTELPHHVIVRVLSI